MCMWPSTAQSVHITHTDVGHHTGQHRFRESPSIWTMSDSRKYCLLCTKCPGLSEGHISDRRDGNITFPLAAHQEELLGQPPTSLVSMSTAPWFQLNQSLCPHYTSADIAPNCALHLQSSLVFTVHTQPNLFLPAVPSQSLAHSGVFPSRKFAWTLTSRSQIVGNLELNKSIRVE